jgi:hypothetical protein
MRSSTSAPAATTAAAGLLLVAQSIGITVSAEQLHTHPHGEQPILCVDNPHYISRFGLNCEMHRKLHCESFAHIGFSPIEVSELYSACPIACRRKECTEEYEAIFENNADGSLFSCEDDQEYTSPFKMKCIDHANIDCEQLIVLGMQPHDMEELLDACPRSCDVPRPECSSSSPIKMVDGSGAGSTSNVGGDAVIVPDESHNNDLSGACFEGWDKTCQDNSEYASPMGLGCAESFGRIDCLKLSTVGFTELQMLQAIQNCPCTCKQECGFSMPPSASPTSAAPTDVPSGNPSKSPSDTPSVPPTMAPTPNPSAVPSASPTFSPTQSPTFSPTNAPTSSPADQPSPSPSSAPTSTPSAQPTVTSSSYPSARPTLSQAPSSYPTVTPSQSPSLQPTQSPSLSHSPSASPSSAPTGVCSTYGWENQCSDDPGFRSFLGLGCAHHEVLVCTSLHNIGFSAKDIDTLIEACPCSCQIECGTWRGAPTVSPTTHSHALHMGFIIETSSPSRHPTTSSPSRKPTTTAPSNPPTTNEPTHAPSNMPISATPTTFAPTSGPVMSQPTPMPVHNLATSPPPIPDRSPLLRGSTDGEPKQEPLVLASAKQEEENATDEESEEPGGDTSFLAIVCIGIFAAFGSIGILLYLRRHKNEVEGGEWNNRLDAAVDEEVHIRSSGSEDFETELPSASSRNSTGRSSYEISSHHQTAVSELGGNPLPGPGPAHQDQQGQRAWANLRSGVNLDPVSSPFDDATGTDLNQAKVTGAQSMDETEQQGCRPAWFGWNLENFGLKTSQESREGETFIVAVEEKIESKFESPQTTGSEKVANEAYFTETLRDIAAARADPSSVQRIVPNMFEEVNDDSSIFFSAEQPQMLSGNAKPQDTDAMMPIIADGLRRSVPHSVDQNNVNEHEETSVDEDCTRCTGSLQDPQKNNSQNAPPARTHIDNEMRKKFARHGLRTISSRRQK